MEPDSTYDFQRTKWFDALSPLERLEVVQRLTAQREEHERQAQAKLIEDIKSSPTPLSEGLKRKVERLNLWDVAEVLKHHPGAELAGRVQSYNTAVQVFDDASADLLAAIDGFDQASKDVLFHHRGNQVAINTAERHVQKELFATTNAAHSLVDHSRNLNKLLQSPEYSPRQNAAFGTDGLHEFVVEFRNVLHHFQMMKAFWEIQQSFRDKSSRATFVVPKDALIAAFEANKELKKPDRQKTKQAIMAFLHDAPDNINLWEVFQEYRRRAAAYHEWFGGELAKPSHTALRDYEDCIRRNRRYSARLMWGGTIGNLLQSKTLPNPYNHLSKVLTTEELAVVNAMEKGSKAQIDKIIELVDEEHCCDDALRLKVYAWFERFAPPT